MYIQSSKYFKSSFPLIILLQTSVCMHQAGLNWNLDPIWNHFLGFYTNCKIWHLIIPFFFRFFYMWKILDGCTQMINAFPFRIWLIYIYINGIFFWFLGCMWCIAGLHDQGWNERAVFGTVRYLSYIGCKRHFDISNFIAKYGGKVYPYEKKHE